MRGYLALIALLVVGCASENDAFDANYCPKVEQWDAAWEGFENEVAALVNQRRSEGGVCGSDSFGPSAPLAMDSALRCAARNHSLDMVTRNYFDHENPDGDDAADRIARAGYEWTAIGENIAKGQPTPEEVMADWMTSAGHCANILEPRFESLGVGFHGSGDVWTQTFGAH